jgi:hypothetical protein
VVTSITILGGCVIHGPSKEALVTHFERMCEEGVYSNDITFVCPMLAHIHACLMNINVHYYVSMVIDYTNISTNLEHYTYMVDLIGCANYLQEVEMWSWLDGYITLLGVCRIHGNVEMVKCVARQIFEIEHDNATIYVLL